MKSRAVFLDRDGTINVERNYLYKIEDFQFIKDAPEAIRILNMSGFLVFVITNQAGIARGYYSEADVNKLHVHINSELKKHGAHIDAFYYCPHHPTEGIGKYRRTCACRKPGTGMLEAAIAKYGIETESSWVIGDRLTDIQAGIKMGIRTILVETSYGNDEPPDENILRKSTIFEAAKYITSGLF